MVQANDTNHNSDSEVCDNQRIFAAVYDMYPRIAALYAFSESGSPYDDKNGLLRRNGIVCFFERYELNHHRVHIAFEFQRKQIDQFWNRQGIRRKIECRKSY